VEDDGNVRHDPHGEFTGRNILYQANSVEQVARRFEVPAAEVEASLRQSSAVLLAERARRPRPHLDDKILTAWNGLMISAFAKGGAALAEPRYEQAARRAAAFLLDHMDQPGSGPLLRRFRDGEAAIPGFLDDYAFLTQGLLDLYEATLHLPYLRRAGDLARRMNSLFEDTQNGGWFSSPSGDASLVLRLKDDYDGAEPSGNSVAILNLLRLAQFTAQPEFAAAAGRALDAFASRINDAGLAIPQMLAALLFRRSNPGQIVITAGQGREEMLRAAGRAFLPNSVVMGDDAPSAASVGARSLGGKATAYVCENLACKLPVTDVAQLAGLLQ
jgi:uncharacterized protein YyaL (SSP411 family)